MKYIIILVLFSIHSYANEFFKKDDLQVAVGLEGKSLLYKRGMVTYKGSQAIPIVSIQLMNPNLLLAGTSLYYKYALNENFLLRTRLNTNSTPDDPLYISDEEEDERVRRDKTNELDFYLEYTNSKNNYLRFQISQDLTAHKGRYFEARGRIPLSDLYKKPGTEKVLLQLGAFWALGYGDEKHNEYLYGTDSDSGSVNNMEYGITITSPAVIDAFWPTLKITHFKLLEDNREGAFVQDEDGTVIEVLAAFRVW